VVTFLTRRRRTPEPLRRARQLARRSRTQQQMPMDALHVAEGHLTDEW